MGRTPPANYFHKFDGLNWLSLKSKEEFENSLMLRINIQKSLSQKEKSFISTIKSLKNLDSITIKFYRIDKRDISKQFQSMATAISSNTSLTKLDINLETYSIDNQDMTAQLLSCLRSPNLASLSLIFFDISEIQFDELGVGIQKLQNLKSLKLRSTRGQGNGKQFLFQSFKNLQQLSVLKVNMSSEKPEIKPTSSKSINLILPECQQLKLSLEDFQYFSLLKEYTNLSSLYLILNNTPLQFLSQVAERQLPNLVSLEKLTLKFPFYTTELVDFSRRAIESIVNLKSLKIILNQLKEIDCNQLLSSLENKKSIESLTIKLKENTTINFSEINVNYFKNIRNLEIDTISCFYYGYIEGANELFLKNLRNLNFLFTLKVSCFSGIVHDVYKSKRLVKFQNFED